MALANAFSVTMFIALTAVAVSYAWGMRGTNLGGEKSAMLPGAIMGTMLAVFSGSPFLLNNAYLMAAAGALGMFFGGHMSYMQSVGMTINKFPPENLRRGMTGLFIKGGVWYGVFGAVTGMFLSFMTGEYYQNPRTVLLLFGLMPLSVFIGERIFDRPFDPKRGVHPRIYFSVDRQDGIGVVLGALAHLIVFMIVCGDWASLAMMAGSLLTGGLGFCLAVQLDRTSKYPNKKGRRFLDKASKKGIVDKVSEFSYGLMGGAGVAATFLLTARLFPGRAASIAGISSIPNLTGDLAPWMLPAVYVALMIAVQLTPRFVKRPPTKAELDLARRRGLMGPGEHEFAMRSAGDEPSRGWLLYEDIFEKFDRPVYCILPLCLMFLGSAKAAALVSLYFMYMVLAEQNIFVRFAQFKTIRLWRVGMLSLGAFLLFAIFFWDLAPGLPLLALLYGAFYEAITLVGHLALRSPDRAKLLVKDVGWIRVFGGKLTTHAWFLAVIALMTALAAWLTLSEGLGILVGPTPPG